jgi:predicted enzyme related to lactoylglutathione lyase
MDRAVSFWREVFGCELRFGDDSWTELAANEATIALHGGHDGSRLRSSLSIEVDDIATACAALVAAGGAVVSGPDRRPGEPILLADATDTEGNRFMLTQYTGG